MGLAVGSLAERQAVKEQDCVKGVLANPEAKALKVEHAKSLGSCLGAVPTNLLNSTDDRI